MGFQMGMLHDTICLTDRFAIEGFFNAGVFYNQVKYSNVMGVFTTQTFADNTRLDCGGRVDVSNIMNNDIRDISEISYMTEASVTAVCRLNKCWALRAVTNYVDGPHPHCRTGVSGQSERGQRPDVPGLARGFGVPALIAPSNRQW